MNAEPDSKRRIIDFLKRRSSATVAELTNHLGVTSTAVRQHLDDLEGTGLVCRLEAVNTGGRGRPRMPWALTELAADLFPDRHADLTVELITAIREAVGDDGLEAVISRRSQTQRESYRAAISEAAPADVAATVDTLADMRSAEGYMADVTTDEDGSLLLTEYHCPICDAAEACQGLCRDELELFKDVLGPDVTVERTSHLLSGDPRCAYRVTPVSISGP